MAKRIFIKQPLVPNGNGCHVISIPSGNMSVEDLLEHIDFQLDTGFVDLFLTEKEASYEEGRAAILEEQRPDEDYTPDPDANYRVDTAIKTGWTPPVP